MTLTSREEVWYMPSKKTHIIKSEYILLICFFILTFIGPNYLYANKYNVVAIPIFLLCLSLYVTRRDWINYDLNHLKSKILYKWIYTGFQYIIITQAIGAIIVGTASIKTDALYNQYPILLLYTVLIGPAVEEIIFRRILFNKIMLKSNVWVGALTSSLLYGLAHQSISKFILYVLIGIIFCWIYRRSGSLSSVIITHILINLTAAIMYTLQPNLFINTSLS